MINPLAEDAYSLIYGTLVNIDKKATSDRKEQIQNIQRVAAMKILYYPWFTEFIGSIARKDVPDNVLLNTKMEICRSFPKSELNVIHACLIERTDPSILAVQYGMREHTVKGKVLDFLAKSKDILSSDFIGPDGTPMPAGSSVIAFADKAAGTRKRGRRKS